MCSIVCRWEPPVYPSTTLAPGTSKGGKKKIESAFAHGTCPPKLIGWDAVRAANLAEQAQSEAQPQTHLHGKPLETLHLA